MEYEVEYWTKRYTFHDWNEDWPTESIKNNGLRKCRQGRNFGCCI